METKRKLREENIRLRFRIAELEERLCPCEEHDWKVIGRRTKIHDYGIVTHLGYLKCRRCGKTKEQEDW